MRQFATSLSLGKPEFLAPSKQVHHFGNPDSKAVFQSQYKSKRKTPQTSTTTYLKKQNATSFILSFLTDSIESI